MDTSFVTEETTDVNASHFSFKARETSLIQGAIDFGCASRSVEKLSRDFSANHQLWQSRNFFRESFENHCNQKLLGVDRLVYVDVSDFCQSVNRRFSNSFCQTPLGLPQLPKRLWPLN